MTGRLYSVIQPRTLWFKRVAERLMQRSPQMNPLDAVRRAMGAFPNASHQDPKEVADSLLAPGPSDDAPGPRAHAASSRATESSFGPRQP